MEAATLDRLFPGRVIFGVGHGAQEWMGQVGVRPDSPLTSMREHLVALKALLAGERVTTSGRLRAARRRGARLAAAPRRRGSTSARPGRSPCACPASWPTARSSTRRTTRTRCAGPARSSTRAARRPGAPTSTRWSSTCRPRPGRTRPRGCAAELVTWGNESVPDLGAAGDAAAVAEAVGKLADAGRRLGDPHPHRGRAGHRGLRPLRRRGGPPAGPVNARTAPPRERKAPFAVNPSGLAEVGGPHPLVGEQLVARPLERRRPRSTT